MGLMEWVTLFFYVTLLLELTVWHIPSVASSVNIMSDDKSLKACYSPKFQWVFELPPALKTLFFISPLLFIYLAHAYPAAGVFIWPELLHKAAYLELRSLLAVALVVAGRGISLAYIFTIRKGNKQRGDSFMLHTKGVYRMSRNPGLLGLYLSFLGFWLAMPHLLFAICLMVYVAHMHFKVRMEEDFLSHKFGAPYLHYLAQSKRYL